MKTRRKAKSLERKTINIPFPESWNKLTKRQLLMIAKLLTLKLNPTLFNILVLLRLTKIRIVKNKRIFRKNFEAGYFFSYKRQVFYQFPDELAAWIGVVKKFMATIDLTVNLLPKLRVFGRTYYGPHNFLYNSTLGEWFYAEYNYIAFSKSNDIRFLNHLVSVLYRKRDKTYNPDSAFSTGDIREPFNEFTFERRAKRLKHLSLKEKTAVFLFYTGVRNHIQSQYEKIFTGGGTSTSNIADSLINLVRSMNDGDPLKNKDLMRTDVYEVLREINDAIINQEKLKKH